MGEEPQPSHSFEALVTHVIDIDKYVSSFLQNTNMKITTWFFMNYVYYFSLCEFIRWSISKYHKYQHYTKVINSIIQHNPNISLCYYNILMN